MRRRLVLYVSAMALGVAALVAIRSFGINLERAVAEQAKEVFGSDLEVRRSAAFPDSTAALLDSLASETGAAVVREVSFPSMARFPASAGGEGRARLAQVRALDGPYPLYGRVQTTPSDAAERIGRGGGALVDATLLLQMEAAVGDSVQVGGRTYPIVGRVDGVPGQAEIASLVGPRVYLPLAEVDSSLLGFGSRARYAIGYRFPDPEAATAAVAPRLDAYEVRYETAGEERQEITEASGYLTRFLSLVGFVALLLGGIGVASSVSVYVGEKAETVATLRCLGVSSGRVLAVYALQALALGAVGAVVGAALGVGVQRLLPLVLQGFLPVDVRNDVVPRALVEGLGVGLVAALLFALLPLVGVRRVPPLRALRSDARAGGVDPAPVAAPRALGRGRRRVRVSPDAELGRGGGLRRGDGRRVRAAGADGGPRARDAPAARPAGAPVRLAAGAREPLHAGEPDARAAPHDGARRVPRARARARPAVDPGAGRDPDRRRAEPGRHPVRRPADAARQPARARRGPGAPGDPGGPARPDADRGARRGPRRHAPRLGRRLVRRDGGRAGAVDAHARVPLDVPLGHGPHRDRDGRGLRGDGARGHGARAGVARGRAGRRPRRRRGQPDHVGRGRGGRRERRHEPPRGGLGAGPAQLLRRLPGRPARRGAADGDPPNARGARRRRARASSRRPSRRSRTCRPSTSSSCCR